MTPQDLKEQLLQREAYALGYKNGSSDVIQWMAENMKKEENLQSKKNIGVEHANNNA